MTIFRRAVLAGALALSTARAGRAQSEPLPLGALYPFSGVLALLGDESYRGLELASDERNASGGLLGRPIRLVKGDAVDPAAAGAEAKRLVGTEKVAAVFGTYASPLVFAASQVTELAGTPYFELGAIADPVMERGFHDLYRSCPTASLFAALAVEAVAGALASAWAVEPSALKIALLHEDGLYGSAVAGAQLTRCKSRGLTVIDKLAYSAATTDLSSAVQRLRGAGATVVLHTGYQNDIVLFYRQLKQAGWFPRMIVGGGAGYSLTDMANTIGADLEGTLNVDFPPYATELAAAPGLRDVEAAYERKYGAKPRSGHSLANYVGARLFFDAIAGAGRLDKDKLHEAVMGLNVGMRTTANSWGARFDDKGQNTLAWPVLSQWQGGTLRAVLPADVATATLRPRLGP